jgi:hypothetical protein
VWPVENGAFAVGFARYGCIDELYRLVEGTTSALDLFATGRMPEGVRVGEGVLDLDLDFRRRPSGRTALRLHGVGRPE